jgi:hypothetical protein
VGERPDIIFLLLIFEIEDPHYIAQTDLARKVHSAAPENGWVGPQARPTRNARSISK